MSCVHGLKDKEYAVVNRLHGIKPQKSTFEFRQYEVVYSLTVLALIYSKHHRIK